MRAVMLHEFGPPEVLLPAEVAARRRQDRICADATAAVRAGQSVLVEAAAGGVGSLLVQLVHGAGADVIAAAGGPRKVAVAEGLGARLAVDYTKSSANA